MPDMKTRTPKLSKTDSFRIAPMVTKHSDPNNTVAEPEHISISEILSRPLVNLEFCSCDIWRGEPVSLELFQDRRAKVHTWHTLAIR